MPFLGGGALGGGGGVQVPHGHGARTATIRGHLSGIKGEIRGRLDCEQRRRDARGDACFKAARGGAWN